MGKVLFVIILFALTLITSVLNGLIQTKGQIKSVKTYWRLVCIPMLFGLATSILGGFIYDSIRSLWFEESVSAGVLRGNYPYFVIVDEKYGNLCIALESQTAIEETGYEVSIRYPNSEFSRVIEWDYREPIWINIEPLEYEIEISLDGEYVMSYPCNVEENVINTVTFPVDF